MKIKFTHLIIATALTVIPVTYFGAISSASAESITPSFPKIITMAMNHFSKFVLLGAEAPTIFPIAATGSADEYYQTYYNTHPIMGYDGYQASYSVELSSPTSPLAYINGSRFKTAYDASNAFESSIGNTPLSGQKSKISLGFGHIGTLTVNKKANTSSITWAEGRWNISVTNAHGTAPERTTASNVVSYLQKYFMPVPLYKAAILVTVDGRDVKTNVLWQQMQEIYTIDTSAAIKSPVTTALAMAISMQPYR